MNEAERFDAYLRDKAVYLHIPFCRTICPYCDFAVVAGRGDEFASYVTALEAEMRLSSSFGPLASVYVGGGTPSFLAPEHLRRLLVATGEHHGFAPGAEISLEANPEDWTPSWGEQVVAAGFNRVSFGAQSFSDETLRFLGRSHRGSEIGLVAAGAKDAGFGVVNLDLIFGSPGESLTRWVDTLEAAISARPDHVSCYALTVERGTPLGRAVASGGPAPDPDVQADMYEAASELLRGAGYVQYEVSNWSRPGLECVYNSIVWAQGEYEGHGNGAHRYRDGVRSRNHRRLSAYLSAIDAGRSPRAGEERVEGWDAEIDRLFVGLRRTVGVADGPGVEALLASPWGVRLVESGIIEHRGRRLVVKIPLLSDEVNRALMSLEGPVESSQAG